MPAQWERDQAGLLILRVLFGTLFVTHGYQKVMGAIQGPGLVAFARSLEHIGFVPGVFWAWVVTIVEFGGGVCILVGLFTRIAATLVAIEMIVAGIKVNLPRGYYWTKGGFEVPLAFAVIALVLVLANPAPVSLDHLFARLRTHLRS